ncbi:MAG: PAS domain S-box protein [Bacteroidales bacterium]
MNYETKSREELINEILELKQEMHSLKSRLEINLHESNQNFEALQKSEEKFQLLFNKAPLGYQSLDFEGNFIEVNQQWLDTLGYEQEEVIGKWFGDFLTPAYQDGFRKRFPKFKAQGHIHSEFEMLHKNGEILFIAFEGKIGYDLKGDFKQTHCILQDITGQKRAEKALLASHHLLNSTFDSLHDAVFIIESKTVAITDCNNAAAGIFGYSRQEIVGSSTEFLHVNKEALEEFRKQLYEAIAEKGFLFLSGFAMKRKDGTVFPTEHTVVQLINEQGVQYGWVSVVRDITESVKTEVALAQSRLELKAIYDLSPIMMCLVDTNRQVIFANHAFTALTGTDEERLKGGHACGVFGCINALDDSRGCGFGANCRNCSLRLAMDDTLKNGTGHLNVEYHTTLLQNGECREVVLLGSTALIENNNQRNLLLCLSDITKRKQAEEEVKKIGQHFQALIENAADGIALIDVEGNFIYISPSAKKMFGYKQTDDLSGHPNEYTHPDDLPMVLTELGKVIGDPSYIPTLEYRFIDKLGYWHWVETTFSNLLANPSVESIVLNFHDITKRKLMEDTQAFLLQISNPGSDENFFESLAKYLSQCLDMEYVCIDILEGDGLTAKTLAIYNEKKFDANVSYTLKDTPCGEVVGNHICCYPEKVCSLFPNDVALQDIKAESYIGTTLWSFEGIPIGLIAVIGQKPLQNQELATSLLKLVSLRAAGKLESILAEEKLKKSEDKFRVLIESTSVAIYLTDLNGKCTYANPKWCELAQLSDSDALGDGWVNGIYEEDREKVFENWQKMVASDGNWGFEYRFGTPDKISWVFGTAKSYKNASGQIVGFIGSNVDITEQKMSEAIFRDIIEKNPISIQILDMEGYPIQVNSAHTNLFGVEPPSDYSVLKDTQLLSFGFSEFFERIKKGEVVYFPDTFYNVHDVDPSFPDSPAWVKALGFTLNNNGKPNKIVLMHENITESKNAEALLNDIIENNPMSIQIVDKEGCTLRVNPTFLKLFGSVPPPQFSIFDDLKSKSPEMENLVSRVINGEIVHLPDIYFNAHEAVAEAPDIPLWIRALIFPLKDSAGKPERFVFIHENITERKIAEQELVIAKNQAEESDRLKSAFLANMSHEIRTPMNGILGFAEVLRDPDLSGEQQQKYLGIIEKSGARMLNIINDIIDISKIEAGLMKVSLSESNINEQIEYIFTFFKQEVEAKGLQLFYNNALPNKEAFILTDREKIFAILTNLVKNAVKYTHQGTIEFGYNLIKANSNTEQNNISELQFFVKDTGIGIPKDRHQAIFERFIQADISDKRAYQGAGLGLSITKAYIELLGGKIWMESEEGIGSCFYFTIPFTHENKVKTNTDKITSTEDVASQCKNLKILIADDDEVSRMLISMVIKKFCSEILTVETGLDALEVCRNNPDLDLIIMDVKMPEMDGYEATKRIREFNNDVIIIIQSAFALSGEKENANAAGCNDYISKPFTSVILSELINKYFNK